MMLKAVKKEAASRLSEVFHLIGLIQSLEAVPPLSDSNEVKVLRGLFWVHLYAALEYSISNGVQRFLQEVGKLNAPPLHFVPSFFSVVLEPNFSALRNVGEDKRWTKRMEFINAQGSGTPSKINADIFGLYLQNVWVEKMETIFSCLEIVQPIVPDLSYKTYIDELVLQRNGIAHGRVSALDAGSYRRSAELLIRYNAINLTCSHFFDCLDQHNIKRGVIHPSYRAAYPLPV